MRKQKIYMLRHNKLFSVYNSIQPFTAWTSAPTPKLKQWCMRVVNDQLTIRNGSNVFAMRLDSLLTFPLHSASSIFHDWNSLIRVRLTE